MISMGCKFRYTKKNTGSSECCLTRAPGRCWLAPWEHISAQKMWGLYGRKTQTPHVYGRITMVFYGYGLWFMVYGYGYCICFPYQSEPNVEPLLWPSQHRSGYPRLPAGRLSTAPLVESKKPPSLFGKL